MKARLGVFAVLLAIGLAGCSKQDDEAASASGSEPDHVWKDQVRALDEAKQVEQTLMDAHQRQTEEIERQQ